MSDTLINTGPMTEPVPVVLANGSKETVSLQPGGRLTLGLGQVIAPTYLAEAHPKILLNGRPLTDPLPQGA